VGLILRGRIFGDLRRTRCRTSGRRETLRHTVQLLPAGGSKQAVVADLEEAGRQYVLLEAVEELPCRESDGVPTRFLAIAVAEADQPVVNAQKPLVGERDAKHVPAQILENLFGALGGGTAVGIPLAPPNRGRNLAIESFCFECVPDFASDDER
jgi:hypothetical protein